MYNQTYCSSLNLSSNILLLNCPDLSKISNLFISSIDVAYSIKILD